MLKRADLAVSLITNSNHGSLDVNHHYSLVQIKIELPDGGAADLDQIVGLLSEYL